jgi:putative cardiolipin synthase
METCKTKISEYQKHRGVARVFLIVALVFQGACSLQPQRSDWLARTMTDENGLRYHNSTHRIALLPNGRIALHHRLSLIREAQNSIRIQTFILGDDPVARVILRELRNAAERGVSVKILADGMLLASTAVEVLAYMSQNRNFEARIYNPVPDIDLEKMNQRMHNKLMIVDERIAVLGGRNLADEYYDADEELNFLDLDVAVEGEAINDMTLSFYEYWQHGSTVESTTVKNFPEMEIMPEDMIRALEKNLGTDDINLHWFEVNELAFWADPAGKPDPQVDPRSFTLRLASEVAKVKEELVIESPYFVLSNNAQSLFGELRKRNINLSLYTNSLASTDNWLTYAHALRQRRMVLEYLSFNVREMRPYPQAMPDYYFGWLSNATTGITETSSGNLPRLCLHSKALVMDNEMAMVGSYNLDPRSANYNTELGVAVRDKRFAMELRQLIETQLNAQNSWIVARRTHSIPLNYAYDIFEEFNFLAQQTTTLDIWPVRYSSLYELVSDGKSVSPDDPRFYDMHRKVGLFPDVPYASRKIFLVELSRMLSGPFESFL